LIILEFITDENRKLVWEDLKQEMKQLTEKKQTILFPCNSISSLSQIEELRKFFENKTTNMKWNGGRIFAKMERCFSKAGLVYNEKRNSLDPYNVEKIVFLKRIWI
jgi:hypothetical protein